ncbi:MAG: hypothetical protein JSV00_05020 [bacterium]|nr:MAG: hypothetical protein JSV00_05020 [bacterium]
MRPSLALLLALLLFLSMGASSGFVGCGMGDGGSGAFVACSTSHGGDDACDYIVTLRVTVLLAADASPVDGASVHVDTGPPDPLNVKVTDATGTAFWPDTAFLTGFSARCDGEDVGTVEPYTDSTSFTFDVLASADGLAPATTAFTLTRRSRDVHLTLFMEP